MTDEGLRKSLGESLSQAAFFGPRDPEAPKQEIEGALLREVLLERDGDESYSGFLRLRNIRVTGDLSMANCRIVPRVYMEDCEFEGRVDFRQAQAPDLEFVACNFERRVDVSQIRMEWNLRLSGANFSEGFSCAGAEINGSLVMDGVTVRTGSGSSVAISAKDLKVGADMLCPRADVEGESSLREAKVGGVLALNEARLRVNAEQGIVLRGEGLSVGGGLFCDEMEVSGEIRLVDARINGVFTMEGSHLLGSRGVSDRVVALRADRLDVTGMVRWVGLQASGLVSLLNATVGGQISLDGADLKGELMLLGARISLEFGLTEAVLDGDGGPALSADRLEVGGGIFCNELESKGEVRFPGAKVGASLVLTATTLGDDCGRNKGIAVYARGIQATGGILATGAEVRGMLDFTGAKVTGRFALSGAELRQGSHDETIFRFVGGATDELMLGVEEADGLIDLRHASVRTLWDDPRNEREGRATLLLQGFQYMTLALPRTADERLRWIEPSQGGGYYPGVYAELASAFRRLGHRGDARRVEIAGARRAIQQLPRWRPRWLWNKLLWITTGSGYRNWLAGLWLLGLLAVGSLAFWCNEGTFLPLTEPHPDFSPVLYAVDATVPVLEVGQQRAFAATGWLRWLSLFLSVSGYALVTAVIAAAAGLLNPDERS